MYPDLIPIGPVSISLYGVLVTLGYFLALGLGAWLASRHEGLEKGRVWDFGITLILASLVGAKVLLILTDPHYLLHPSNLLSVDFLRSAGVFYGGFISGLAWSGFYFWRHRVPGWRIADAFAAAIPLGHALGRLGCFTAGCCHGSPAPPSLGITFSNPQCMVENHLLGVPLYPTQILEALANAALCIALLRLYRNKRFHGQLILIYAMSYSLIRFSLEFLRGDERGSLFGGAISTSQFIALLIFPAALATYLIRRRRPSAQVVPAS